MWVERGDDVDIYELSRATDVTFAFGNILIALNDAGSRDIDKSHALTQRCVNSLGKHFLSVEC